MSRYAPEGVEKEVMSDRPGICEELCCLPGGCRQCVCVLISVPLQPPKEDSFKVTVPLREPSVLPSVLVGLKATRSCF